MPESPAYQFVGIFKEKIQRLICDCGSRAELLAEKLKIVSDQSRLEILMALKSGSLCGLDLVDLLQEKPLEKITVTDVVNRAEINRGTFYAHYKDIPDVVNQMIQQTFSTIREGFPPEPRPLTEVTHVLLKQVQTILEEDLLFCRKIMNSSAADLMKDRLVEIVMDFMLQHKDEFVAGEWEQYDPAIRFCAGGLSNLYRDWFAGKLPYALSDLTEISERFIRRVIYDVR